MENNISFDLAYRSELAGDPIVGPLIASFVAALSQHMIIFRSAEQQSDWKEISRLAHQLIGSCGGYGFTELGKIAAQIERIAKSEQNPKVLAEWISRFETLCAAAERGLSCVHEADSLKCGESLIQ